MHGLTRRAARLRERRSGHQDCQRSECEERLGEDGHVCPDQVEVEHAPILSREYASRVRTCDCECLIADGNEGEKQAFLEQAAASGGVISAPFQKHDNVWSTLPLVWALI